MQRPLLHRLATVTSIGIGAFAFIATSAPPPEPPVCGDGVLLAGEICFSTSSAATGNNPNSVAIGDINGDALPDVVVANGGASSVSVFLGRGSEVTTPVVLDVGGLPFSVELNDLDLDGNLDLIVLDRGLNLLRVLLGNGDTTFDTLAPISTGGLDSDNLIVADLNGDLQLDAVTLNINSQDASILLGNGDGTFGAPTLLGLGANVPSLALGDLNNDQLPELVSVHPDTNQIIIHKNQNGSFVDNTALIVGLAPASAVVLGGEVASSIFVACPGFGEVLHITATEEDIFSIRSFADSSALSLFAGDINGDGGAEIVAIGNSLLSVLDHPFSFFLGSENNERFDVAFGDLNLDGVGDMAVSNQNTPELTLFFSQP